MIFVSIVNNERDGDFDDDDDTFLQPDDSVNKSNKRLATKSQVPSPTSSLTRPNRLLSSNNTIPKPSSPKLTQPSAISKTISGMRSLAGTRTVVSSNNGIGETDIDQRNGNTYLENDRDTQQSFTTFQASDGLSDGLIFGIDGNKPISSLSSQVNSSSNMATHANSNRGAGSRGVNTPADQVSSPGKVTSANTGGPNSIRQSTAGEAGVGGLGSKSRSALEESRREFLERY